jgi:hypothetical protein
MTLFANTGTGLSYQWYRDSVTIPGANSASLVINLAGNYSVLVTTGLGCSRLSAVYPITLNPLPSAVISASGPLAFCSGDSVTLTVPLDTTNRYQWQLGAGNVVGATSSVFKARNPGSYRVMVVSAQGCTSYSAPAVVSFNPSIGINLASGTGSNNQSVCKDSALSSIIFTTQLVSSLVVNGLPAGVTYSWSGSVLIISGNPTSVGTFNYTVVATGGCPNANNINFGTIVVTNCVCTPPPALVTISGPAVVCGVDSVLLNANTGVGLTYQWRSGSTAISGATNSSLVVRASGSYTVVVYNSPTCSTISAPAIISIGSNPAAVITPNGATTFCSGGSVTLNGNSGSGLTYVWLRDSVAIAGATSSSYNATQSGSYRLRVVSGSCSTLSAPVLVTVNTLPSAVVSPSGPLSLCPGQSITLNANSGSSLTYQWRSNGVPIPGATLSSYSASATGTYSVLVTSSSGCSTTSNSVTLSVSNPSASITPLGSTTFCTGGSVVLNANTGSGLSYQWLNNGAAVPGATLSSYTATGSGVFSVVVSLSGCSATSTSVTVTQVNTPQASISASGPLSFCQGGSVLLTANSGSGLAYQWKNAGVNIAGATNSTYLASSAGSYSVAVSSGNCSSTSTVLAVTVNSNPTASVTAGGSTSLCSGQSVVLSANAGPGLSYQWQINGANLPGFTAVTYTASSTGSYSVVVTNASGCVAVASPVSVTVNATPIAVVSASGSTVVCAGASVLLNATTGSGYAYQWRRDGSNISGATNATYTASITGDYSVSVAASGCTSVSQALRVTVNSNSSSNLVDAICPGAYLLFGGDTLRTAGTYRDTVASYNGCDSLITLTLSVLPRPQRPVIRVSPRGDSLIATPANNLTWYRNNVLVPGGRNGVLLINLNGRYTAIRDTALGARICYSDTSVAVNVTNVSVFDQTVNYINVYPVPADQAINISGLENFESITCIIYDVAGRKMDQIQWSSLSHSESVLTYDVSHYAAGVYSMLITDPKKGYTESIRFRIDR